MVSESEEIIDERLQEIELKRLKTILKAKKRNLEEILSDKTFRELLFSLELLETIKEYRERQNKDRVALVPSGNYYYVYSYFDKYSKKDKRNIPTKDESFGRISKRVYEQNQDKIETLAKMRKIEKLKEFIEPLENKK